MTVARLITEIQEYLVDAEHFVSQREAIDLLTRALVIVKDSELYTKASIEEIVTLKSQIEILENKIKQTPDSQI